MVAVGWIAFLWEHTEAIRVRREVAQRESAAYCQQLNHEACEATKSAAMQARAEQDAVDAAVWQIWLNVAGLLGLGATVLYARRAWREAERSAKAATEALDHTRADAAAQADRFSQQLAVANRQVEIADDTAKKQLRAYVYVERMDMLWLDDGPVFNVVFRNSGATPAINLRAGAEIVFCGPADIPPMPENISMGRIQFIGASATRKNQVYTANRSGVSKESISFENNINVFGRVQYQDIFAQTFETEFAFYTHTAEPDEEGMVAMIGHRAAFRAVT